MSKHPMQPLIKDEHGTIRFSENKIVRFILDEGGIDLNRIGVYNFDQSDREQFAQLIGYSLSGYHELSYVSDESARAASEAAKQAFKIDIAGCRDEGCRMHTHAATSCYSCGGDLGTGGCDTCDDPEY